MRFPIPFFGWHAFEGFAGVRTFLVPFGYKQFADRHFLAPAEMGGDEVDCTGTHERQANLRPWSARKTMMLRHWGTHPRHLQKRDWKMLKTKNTSAKKRAKSNETASSS